MKQRNKVRKEGKKAVAFLRTSSATNVGEDKDNDKRQRAAIEAFAKTAGYEIYDAAVSVADPVSEGSGFADILERIDEQWRADDPHRIARPFRR